MSVPGNGNKADEDGFKSRETIRDECKGERIMEIDFIEWMCDKASGFECTGVGNCRNVTYRTGRYCMADPIIGFERSILCELLLQKASEGINESSAGFFINQTCDNINVYEFMGINNRYFYFDQYKWNVNKAKEFALRYIYEQETK
jgi:hypothetical protein